jgi:hypothetical protein
MSLEVPIEELERISLYDIAKKKREEREVLPVTRVLYVVYFNETTLAKVDVESSIKS